MNQLNQFDVDQNRKPEFFIEHCLCDDGDVYCVVMKLNGKEYEYVPNSFPSTQKADAFCTLLLSLPVHNAEYWSEIK